MGPPPTAQKELDVAFQTGSVLASAFDTDVDQLSDLQIERLRYRLELPQVLDVAHRLVDGELRRCTSEHAEIAALFPNLSSRGDGRLLHLEPADNNGTDDEGSAPLRVGVVLSGGQAAGGHNVIIGLFEYLQRRHPRSVLFGFLDGFRGVMQQRYKELKAAELSRYCNLGGFHMLGSGRDKIEKPEQLAQAAACATLLDLDGLVVVGGDDSNTNAAVLAEYFLGNGLKTCVVGVPKTLDGDLKNGDVPISFGFDTACKVYSELIGNIMIDAASARKYWHFVRLMGRSASHVTLECALQTHPQWAFISEEVAAERISLRDVASKVADLVAARAAAGKNYGVVLLPEGLVEYAHDMSTLIKEINALLVGGCESCNLEEVARRLSPASRAVFEALSVGFQKEFLEDRDPHGNVQVSHIETEKLLVRMVEAELRGRAKAGAYSGKFAGVPHFFGYEGRCALPSNFDCSYTAVLGAAAGALLGARRTGLMATASDLHLPAARWRVGGTPLVSMMCMELRHGRRKPVVRKALVELRGAPMTAYRAVREYWALHDCFRSPGPIQFTKHECADVGTITLALEINNGKQILLSTCGED